MNKLDIPKALVRYAAGAGAAKIAKDIIKQNTTPKSQLDIVTHTLGAVAIGGIVSDAAKKYIDTKVEETLQSVEKVKAQLAQHGVETPADAVEKAKDTANDVAEKLNGDDSPQA